MKIALANLMFESGKTIPTKFRRQEHLGIGYIGAICLERGHQVEVINGQYDCLDSDQIFQRIKGFAPRLVGVSLYEAQLAETKKLLRMCKTLTQRPLTVVGGHSATFNAEALLRDCEEIDVVALGEGELSFPLLAKAYEKGGPIEAVRGFCFRSGDEIINTGYADKIVDLDELPYPIRPASDKRLAMTNICASRGCHATCSFCSTITFYQGHSGKRIRSRDPILVVDEIEHLVRTQNSHHFFFTDDNFFVNERLNPGWIYRLSNELERRRLDIVFNFDCRVDEVEGELFARMKSVGLVGVFLGVESNSKATLKFYDKRTSPEMNLHAIDILRRLRIDYWLGNIMFHPLATMDDIEKDIEFLETINYHRYFNYSYPVSCFAGVLEVYNGTKIHDMLQQENTLEGESVVVACKFAHERTDVFYKFVCRWKKFVAPLVSYDPIFMIEIANKHGRRKLASRIHADSRKYMKLDFKVFRDMHAAFRDESRSCDEGMRIAEDVIQRGKPMLVDFRQRLHELRQEIKRIQEVSDQRGVAPRTSATEPVTEAIE